MAKKKVKSKSSGKTYEDSSGKVFKTHAEAAASNTKMGTNPSAKTSTKSKDVNDNAGGSKSSSAPVFDIGVAYKMIDGLSLTQDQKEILKLYAKANIDKNPALANQIMAALETSTRFSIPQFKQQAAMLQDALKLNFTAREGDLAFKEQQQRDALAKAEGDYAATSQYNTFEENQKLKQYADTLKQDLLDTQDQMAASGFTSSSKRSRAEQILNEQNTGLVESTTKAYSYQQGNIDRQIGAARTDVAAQIANLQRLTAEGKLSDLRTAEGKLGSSALFDYGNMAPLVAGQSNLLGGQVGSENYDLTSTITKNAGSFVF